MCDIHLRLTHIEWSVIVFQKFWLHLCFRVSFPLKLSMPVIKKGRYDPVLIMFIDRSLLFIVYRPTQPKSHNLFRAVENSIEQCLAANIVQ